MPINLRQFGRYELIRRISLGGMAEVFKAKSYDPIGFEKVVALKRLLPTIAENDDFIEMFLQEAKLAAKLDHQNICRVLELGKVMESYYITMEFIYGHDLRQAFKIAIKNKIPIDPWIVAWIGALVTEGLTHAYNAQDAEGQQLKIVHRDISPQNIMIGFDGTVKIIDFGIAKAAVSTIQTAAGILKGKYAYMSPEHAGRKSLDARSDIWSLGVVMYEMLSGRRLFVGDVVADVIEQVLNRPIEPLQGVPERLANVVHKMLDRNVDKRYLRHEDVNDDLMSALRECSTPITSQTIASWMDQLFPTDRRIEADLTDDDVRVLLSAEERDDTTTDQRSDISSATQIFLADETGHTDYLKVIERMMAEGRVSTTAAELPADEHQSSDPPLAAELPAPKAAVRPDTSSELGVLYDALWSTIALVALTIFLLNL